MATQTELSIVIPAYNEAGRLPQTLDALLLRLPPESTEFIVVDDGSLDDTSEVANARLALAPHGRVITLPENRGKGAAVRTGVAASTGSMILTMDADLATDLTAVDSVLEILERADIAVGSRAVPGSTVAGTSAVRAVMGRSFNRMVRLLTGLDVQDSQCGFKAFRGDVGRLLFSLSRVDGFAYDPEVLLIARDLGFRMEEVPVAWTAIEGSSVRPIRDSLRTGASLVAVATIRRRSRIRAEARRRGWTG